MSDKSGIEWTEATWNPLVGCTSVSPGCDNCYARTQVDTRFHPAALIKGGKHLEAFPAPFETVSIRPDRFLTQPLHWAKPRRIFVNSLSDLFHKDVPDEFIARVWQVMGAAPQHTYQILTKRHARMRSWVNRWYSGEIPEPYEVRPVPGYPGYAVSTLGEVFGKRADTSSGLSCDVGEQGHRRVTMHREGSPHSGSRELVHRLVLTAFVRPPHRGEQACHRNGDPSDNRLSNLYWGSQQANWRDRLTHGHGRSYSKLEAEDVAAIRGRRQAGESAYAIAKDYPVSDTQIRNICRGDQWAASAAAVPPIAPARVVLDCVWLGVSVEDQQWADVRIPVLLETPAAVRFLSCEPLLGPVTFRWAKWAPVVNNHHLGGLDRIDWVIAGGESGPSARPMHPDWARALRDQCNAAGVPFLFKQWGEWGPTRRLGAGVTDDPRDLCVPTALNPNRRDYEHGEWLRRVGKKAAGRELDGRTWDEYPERQVTPAG